MTNTLLHKLLSNKGTISWLSLCLIFANHVSSQRRKDLQEFNLNGCVKTIDRVKYDAKWNNGNIVKGERSSEDFQENYIATFTPDGFLLEQFFLDMSETVYSKVINLNSADKLISYGFDDLDRLACLFIKHFNNEGQLVETLQYNLNGDLEGRYTYHYSSENDLLCEMNLYTPDSLLFKERIIYNAENKIVSKATYDSDDNL